MYEQPRSIIEVREEVMVSPMGESLPCLRKAQFLQPTVTCNGGKTFEIPSSTLSSLPPTFEPTKWPLTTHFKGWRFPPKKWRSWVDSMHFVHESVWKKAGIFEAILNSKYELWRSDDLIFGIAERWSTETKTFIFPWAEATITLEDIMVLGGYSIWGDSVHSPIPKEELKETEEKLIQARREVGKQYRNANPYAWMRLFMNSGSEIEHEAFLATWLSTFVFPISGLMRKDVFPFAIQLARGNPIALAPAVLATIYRDLDLLKEAIVASTKKFQTGGDENDSLGLVLWSPFYLVQIWAWERIQALQPKPNTIKIDDPILARWHKVRNLKVHNTRLALNTAGESFLWRPYAILVRKCSFPNIYSEKEVWVPVDPNLNKELLSFAECLRVSELFGLDCRTWYHPHRVAMQFGIDQDIPGCVGEWPINEGKLYIPARLFESDVTTRYLEWYRQSVLVPLDPIKDLKRKKRSARKSNLAAEASNAKGDNDTNIVSPCFPIKSKMKFLHEILEDTKGDNNADVPSGFHPKPNSNNVKDVSESMKGYDMLDVPPGFPPKHNTVNSGNSAEECEPTLMELNRSAESAYSVDVYKAPRGDDTVDVPSAVHPKHSTVDSGNSVEEGLPAIVELTCSAYMNDSNRTLKSSINSIEEVSEVIKEDKTADVSTGFPRIHDTVNSGKSVEQGMSTIMEMTGAADMDENLGNRTTHDHDAMCLSGQPAHNSSPSIEDGSAKKMDQLMNSVVKTESEDYLGGLEETMEDVGDRKVASPVDDKVTIHSTEGKRSRMTSDEMSLDSVQEFEERISKLERVVADLTAAPIRQSSKNETAKHG